MKRSTAARPTEAEIRSYENVPVHIAAKFIGTSSKTLYEGLQYQLCPFGWAVQNKEAGSWRYLIPPERLIRYQNGEMADYKLDQIIRLASAGVERVVQAQMENIQRVLDAMKE